MKWQRDEAGITGIAVLIIVVAIVAVVGAGVAITRSNNSAVTTPTPTLGLNLSGAQRQEFTGLCNAYFRGSERGQEQKRDATAFERLTARAQASGMSVEQFCRTLNVRATGSPSAEPTSSASPTQTDDRESPSPTSSVSPQATNSPGM